MSREGYLIVGDSADLSDVVALAESNGLSVTKLDNGFDELTPIDSDEFSSPNYYLDEVLRADFHGKRFEILGKPVHLSNREAQLLEFIVSPPDFIHPHKVIEENVWGSKMIHPRQSTRVYAGYLRKKLKTNEGGAQIESAWGQGLKFVPTGEHVRYNESMRYFEGVNKYTDERLDFDFLQQTFLVDGEPVYPSRPEAAVLEALADRRGHTVSHSVLRSVQYGNETEPITPIQLKVTIAHLRTTLGDNAENPTMIGTDHGLGYCLIPTGDAVRLKKTKLREPVALPVPLTRNPRYNSA